MKVGNKRTNLIIISVAILLFAAVISLYLFFRLGPQQGVKDIYVSVVHGDSSVSYFEYSTKAEFLGDVLTEEGLLEGEAGPYGLWVTVMDGEEADDSKQEWWGYTVNGAFSMYGVDQQPIMDGDSYEFTLNVGY